METFDRPGSPPGPERARPLRPRAAWLLPPVLLLALLPALPSTASAIGPDRMVAPATAPPSPKPGTAAGSPFGPRTAGPGPADSLRVALVLVGENDGGELAGEMERALVEVFSHRPGLAPAIRTHRRPNPPSAPPLAPGDPDLIVIINPPGAKEGHLSEYLHANHPPVVFVGGPARRGSARSPTNRLIHRVAVPSMTPADVSAFLRLVPGGELAVVGVRTAVEPLEEGRPRGAGLPDGDVPVRPVLAGSSITETLARLPERPGAVVVLPVPGMSDEERAELADSLRARGIASMGTRGRADLTAGFLAAPELPSPRTLARTAAVTALEALDADPGLEPVADPRASDLRSLPRVLVVNRQVAEALGLEIPVAARVEVHWFDGAEEPGATLTLEGAVREAVANDPKLAAAAARTEAHGQRVSEAGGRLLPQLGAEVTGRLVEEETARASFGNLPQHSIEAAATFRQVLFSEPAFADLSIQARLHAARIHEEETRRLDAAVGGAAAWLAALQARSAVRVQEEHLELARAALEGAVLRQRTGAAGSADVSRLEAEVARSRARLAVALERRETAAVRLNRILGRPLEAHTPLPRLPSPAPAAARPLLAQSGRPAPGAPELSDPALRSDARDHWLREAAEHSPETAGLRAAVEAGQRREQSARRAAWAPEVTLRGRASTRIAEGGTGTSPPLPPDAPFTLPSPPRDGWTLELAARLPLFDGRVREARSRRASDELRAARHDLHAVERIVEERVRAALAGLEAAAVEANQALLAYRSAERSHRAVEAAYRHGGVDVLDLMEALRQLRVTREEAYTTLFRTLETEIRLERAVGRIGALDSDTGRRANAVPSGSGGDAR